MSVIYGVPSGPRITHAYIGALPGGSGTPWNSTFLNYLGSDYGYSIPVGRNVGGNVFNLDTRAQLHSLPWINLNCITLGFNQDVNVSSSSLSIAGVAQTYTITDFVYRGYINDAFYASWYFDQSNRPAPERINTDKIRVTLLSKTVDVFFDNVSLLLHMNGANGSTTFIDSSKYQHTVTANGNAQISTAQSKFGGASVTFDGAGDYLSLPSNAVFSFGTDDFCIESWVYPTTTSGIRMICDCRSGDVLGGWSVAILAGNTLDFIYRSASPSRLTTTTTVPQNRWSHIAITRVAGTIRLFINGVVEATAAFSGDVNAGGSPAIGGGRSTAGSGITGYYLTGNINDLRITKGVSRYTGSFIPPARTFASNLTLPYGVTSKTFDLPLAGAITNATWTSTGDATTAAGIGLPSRGANNTDFSLRLNVLPADFNSDTGATSLDSALIVGRVGQTVASGNYTAFADLNGDGIITGLGTPVIEYDRSLSTEYLFTTLPTGTI